MLLSRKKREPHVELNGHALKKEAKVVHNNRKWQKIVECHCTVTPHAMCFR
jgi:hypothetical protein